MFPRLSLLHRFIAISVCIACALLIFSSQMTNSGEKTRREILWAENMDTDRIRGKELSRSFVTGQPSLKFNVTLNSSEASTNPPPQVVNPHDFSYIINPVNLCQMKKIFMVIYIHSAPKHYKKRQLIRQTWGSKEILTKYKMRIVFIMGAVPDDKIMDGLKMESDRYGDLVVEDFLDSYRNLTYKAVASLRWVSQYCKHATYILKTDDDIMVDIHSLIRYIKSPTVREYGTKNLLMCNQWTRMKVIRDKKSKWYISKSELSSEYFSPYCSGSAFVMTPDVAQALYDVSFYTPFFWVDDFYLTGQLVQKLNIQHKRLNEGYMLNAKVALEKLNGDTKQVLKFFHLNRLTYFSRMWDVLRKRDNWTCSDCQSTVSPPKGSPSSNSVVKVGQGDSS